MEEQVPSGPHESPTEGHMCSHLHGVEADTMIANVDIATMIKPLIICWRIVSAHYNCNNISINSKPDGKLNQNLSGIRTVRNIEENKLIDIVVVLA